MGIPKLRAMGFGKPFGEGFAKGYTFEPSVKGMPEGKMVGGQFAPSAVFQRAPKSAYEQLSEVGRIGFASGRAARDFVGLGTRSRVFFNSHPLDFSQGHTNRMLVEKGAPSWYGQTAGAAVGLAVGVGSGNLDLRNPGEAGRPKEYQPVFPVMDGQDPVYDESGKIKTQYGALGEWFGRSFLGQTGRMLPYDQLSQVRPDITEEQYNALKKQQMDRNLIGGDAGTVPYAQVLGGAFKFTPYNPLSGQPELTSLGYRVPASAIALGAATAYGSVRLADKLFNKQQPPTPAATVEQPILKSQKATRSAPTPGGTPPVTPSPSQPAPATGLNTAQLNKSYGDAFSRVRSTIPKQYQNAANIEKFLASDPAFSQADPMTRQAVAQQFEQKLGTTPSVKSQAAFRSPNFEYGVVGGRQSLRDRLSGGMSNAGNMAMDQGGDVGGRLPRRIQAKLDAINQTSQGIDAVAAKNLAASQMAINEATGNVGYRPEIPQAQSTYQAPTGSGRQRVRQLISDLRTNVEKDAVLTNATEEIARRSLGMPSGQYEQPQTIRPRLGGGTRTVRGETFAPTPTSQPSLPPAQSTQPSIADMQSAQKAAIARLRGTTSVSIGDGVTVQTASPRRPSPGTVAIGDGVRARLPQSTPAPSTDVALSRSYSGLQQQPPAPYTPKAKPQSTLIKQPGDYSIRTQIADLRKPPLEGDYQKTGSRSYIGAGGDRTPDVKYEISRDRLTPEQYTRRLQVNEALRGNANAGVQALGNRGGVTMPGGRGITTAIPQGKPQSAPAPVVPYSPQQPVAKSAPKVAQPGSTAIVPYQSKAPAAYNEISKVPAVPEGTTGLNVGKVKPTRPAETPALPAGKSGGFKLGNAAGTAVGGALTAYAAASEYGRARSEGASQGESIARAGVGVLVGAPQFVAGAAAQGITDTVRGVGGIAKQLGGASKEELKQYDRTTQQIKQQVAQRTEDIPKAIVKTAMGVYNNAYSAVTGKGEGVPDQKALQAVGDKATNRLLEASAKYRLVRQADGSVKSVPNSTGGEQRAQVTRVVDGDTVYVKKFDPKSGGMVEDKIRVANLNAPERNTPTGPAATKSMQQKADVGSVIYMRGQGVDKYGRSLREISSENKGAGDIGKDMQKEGTAKPWVKKSDFSRQVDGAPASQQPQQPGGNSTLSIPQVFVPGSEEFKKLDSRGKQEALRQYGKMARQQASGGGGQTAQAKIQTAQMQYGEGGSVDRTNKSRETIATGNNKSREKIATGNNQTKLKVADMQYGKGGSVDRTNVSKEKIADMTSARKLQGTVYTADKRLEGTKYTADSRLKGTVYTADQKLRGTVYTADKKLEGQDLTSGRKLQGDVYKADKAYQGKVDSAIVTGDYKVKVANTQGQYKLGAEDIKGQYGVEREKVKGEAAVKVAEVKAGSGGDSSGIYAAGAKQLSEAVKLFSTDQAARRKERSDLAKVFAQSSRR